MSFSTETSFKIFDDSTGDYIQVSQGEEGFGVIISQEGNSLHLYDKEQIAEMIKALQHAMENFF